MSSFMDLGCFWESTSILTCSRLYMGSPICHCVRGGHLFYSSSLYIYPTPSFNLVSSDSYAIKVDNIYIRFWNHINSSMFEVDSENDKPRLASLSMGQITPFSCLFTLSSKSNGYCLLFPLTFHYLLKAWHILVCFM